MKFLDIEQNYDLGQEEEQYNVGLILLNLETQETKFISNGSGSDRINNVGAFGWINNNRIWYVPRFDLGKKAGAAFAINLDGSRRTTLWKYGEGSNTYPYEMAYDDPQYIYVQNNKRRPAIYDYYKLDVYTGKMKIIAFGPDSKGFTLGSLNHKDGQPLGILFDTGLGRQLLEYKQDTKEWVPHFKFYCQKPGFVPIGMYKGKMVVAGSKFSPDGSVIEKNDTNAIYLYDYKNRTFGDKLFQDPDFGPLRNQS